MKNLFIAMLIAFIFKLLGFNLIANVITWCVIGVIGFWVLMFLIAVVLVIYDEVKK